jgi:hypothetical protein
MCTWPCGCKKMWQNDYPFFFVQKFIFGWGNITLLSFFQLWFWRQNELFSSIMCTWENMCFKYIWNKHLAKFSTFCKLQMIKHCCFPRFLEVSSFVPLSFDVMFKFNFSPCTNVCHPTLLLLWGWSLNACLCTNALVQDQGKYAYEQTIDNYG